MGRWPAGATRQGSRSGGGFCCLFVTQVVLQLLCDERGEDRDECDDDLVAHVMTVSRRGAEVVPAADTDRTPVGGLRLGGQRSELGEPVDPCEALRLDVEDGVIGVEVLVMGHCDR